jgi:hypothetical protein
MFTVSRVIAIDDESNYLEQLCGALHEIGIPCVPISYPDRMPIEEARWLQGVRVAFCDLHLLRGAKPELNYPVIGSILERMVRPGGSPLLLILWTAYPEDADALRKYLAERHANHQPAALVALDKKEFVGEAARNLPGAIREKLNAAPQLRALYEWEDDVATAANDCVGALMALATKAGGGLAESLDQLLSALAQAATGKQLAADNPGGALQEVLVPLLADRLTYLPEDGERLKRWKEAMPSAVAKKPCKLGGVAEINTALNVVHGTGLGLTGRERGAVISIDCLTLFLYRFGASREEVFQKFALPDSPQHRWVAIQVEPACDFAQQKSACLPFVLALEVPSGSKILEQGKGRPDSLWVSPIFLSETKAEVRLVANVRYVSMISTKKAKSQAGLYRLREPLINELAFHKSRHESRPGIVSLD